MIRLFDPFAWWVRPAPALERARPMDAAAMAAIHARSFRIGWDENEMLRMIADHAVVAHVIRRRAGADVAGFVLSRITVDEAEIFTVAVTPAMRGRGYAGFLLDNHLPALARAGARSVFLEVATNNAAALALYAGKGFARAGLRKGYYRTADGASDALVMHRDLAVG